MNFFDGPDGKRLFERPLLRLFRHNPVTELFHSAEQSDDRLMTLLTALVVEGRLDACLSAFLPKYAAPARLSTTVEKTGLTQTNRSPKSSVHFKRLVTQLREHVRGPLKAAR